MSVNAEKTTKVTNRVDTSYLVQLSLYEIVKFVGKRGVARRSLWRAVKNAIPMATYIDSMRHLIAEGLVLEASDCDSHEPIFVAAR